MDKILIGLVAPKRSGKDTVANYLCSSYGFKKYNFADPLKKGIKEIFGLTYEQLDGKDKEVVDPFWGITPRELFQKIGTEIFQFELPKVIEQFGDFDRTFWVKCFEKWYITKKEEYEINRMYWSNNTFEKMLKDLPVNLYDTTKPIFRVVVSDVRFKHEAKKIKEMGGILIKINRSVEENDYSTHLSEKENEEINCDYTIENNDYIVDVYEQFDNLMAKILYCDI
jgi:hypothetical protein